MNTVVGGVDGERLEIAGTARAHWLMLGLAAAACAMLWHGEHILAGGGLGWDGATYGAIAKDPAMALHDKYYLHRALPSWVVHAALRLLRLPIDDARVIQGFLALNTILILASTALWRPVADRLRLGVPARWIGFAGLFCNFAVLKMPFYYPVFTDTAAFALGVVIVFASLTGRQWLLALALLACTFTWPLASVFVAPLLLWPPGRLSAPPARAPALLPTLAAVGAASAFLAWFVWMYVVRGQNVRASHLAVPVVGGVVWIGIAGAIAFIVYSVRCALAGVTMRYAAAVIRRADLRGLALLIAVMVPAEAIVALMGEGQPVLSTRYFISNVVFFSSTRPFLFAITNIIYFGPLLLLLFSRPVRSYFVQAFRDLGPGWMLFVVATVGLSLNSESRQSILQYPAIAILIALAADRSFLSARVGWAMVAVGLAVSRVWLPINTDPARMLDSNDPQMAWHYRRYFMNQGPWMSNEDYVINVLTVGIAGLAIWWILRGAHIARHPTPAGPGDPSGARFKGGSV